MFEAYSYNNIPGSRDWGRSPAMNVMPAGRREKLLALIRKMQERSGITQAPETMAGPSGMSNMYNLYDIPGRGSGQRDLMSAVKFTPSGPKIPSPAEFIKEYPDLAERHPDWSELLQLLTRLQRGSRAMMGRSF